MSPVPRFDRPASNLPAARVAVIALVTMAVASLTGCVGPAPTAADWERRTTHVLQGRKAESQALVERDRIAGEPAAQFVGRRTALLIGGPGRVTTKLAPNGRTAMVAWEMKPEHKPGGISSAAAITDDGYFLTAAHAVSEARMQLVRPDRNGLGVGRVRVVWRGDPERGGPDLALIHAPSRGQAFLTPVDPDTAPHRSRVWTGGFGDVRQNQSRGRLRFVGPWKTGADGSRWRTVEHSAPLMRGDSGGPLVDGSGRLLGVNTEFLVQPATLLGHDHLRVYRPVAMAIDPEWLGGVIARDRARRLAR